MCPACLAATAAIVAGATSAGGLGALVAKKLRAGVGAEDFQLRMQPEGERDGTPEDRVAE
jgi:hypothetical protein